MRSNGVSVIVLANYIMERSYLSSNSPAAIWASDVDRRPLISSKLFSAAYILKSAKGAKLENGVELSYISEICMLSFTLLNKISKL